MTIHYRLLFAKIVQGGEKNEKNKLKDLYF